MKYGVLFFMALIISSPPAFADNGVEFALNTAPSLMYSAGVAMDGQALLARTPSGFRRYKIAALAAEILHTIPYPFFIAASVTDGVKSNILDLVVFSIMVSQSILRIRQLVRHAKNADKLHLLLAKKRLPDENLRAAVHKETFIEFAVAVARSLAVMAAMKTQPLESVKKPGPLLKNLLIQSVVEWVVRKMFNDESMINQMSDVFDGSINKNEEFMRLFKHASA
jgi:hypothetical protein